MLAFSFPISTTSSRNIDGQQFKQNLSYFGIPVNVTSFLSSFANVPYLTVCGAIPGNYSSEKHACGTPYWEKSSLASL